tara:strand:+ start:24432 stop:25961 length:1530 start_codon:yes stop_codon:yes gene_type:complete
MKFELIIDSRPSEVVIALLRDQRLIELHKEQNNNSYSVGDIYIGKVKKVVPGLNAAFVNVGHEKDGFLHYLDLGPNIGSYQKYTDRAISKKSNTASLKNFRKSKVIEKSGLITDVLKSGDHIMVQVSKEAISSKGPRLTAEISIAGRNMVLLPFSNKISLSNKIRSQEEKVRLKRLLKSIKPEGFGIIVRTVAKGKKVIELDSNLKVLYKRWQGVFKELKGAKAGKMILKELNRSTAILRDILTSEFNSIHVNDKELYIELKDYLLSISPKQEKILKLYKSKTPILQNFDVTKQIKSSFGKTVNMKNGTYLVIEHTEAMHVIDVNSGKKVDAKKDQEENALLVNLKAAEEVARQLRLRDMGGIIVVDFIDMNSSKNRKLLFEKMREYMKGDKAKHHILPPTKFGLVQITRQRVRPEMNIDTREDCPMCIGNGKIDSSLLLIDTIENKIKNLIDKSDNGKIRISTHPFIASHINKGIFSKGFRWSLKFKRIIQIVPDERLHLLQYSIVKK